jgi:hypothetical protein
MASNYDFMHDRTLPRDDGFDDERHFTHASRFRLHATARLPQMR